MMITLASMGAAGLRAQNLPPDLLPAYSIGQAAHMLAQASPCFPRQGGDADLWRMLQAALGKIHGDAGAEEAFERGRALAAIQQRYIGRSDPVACGQIRAALEHFLVQP